MDGTNRAALLASTACAAVLAVGGGAAWAASQGGQGDAAPRQVTSTEDGNAGQETYRTRSTMVTAGSYGSLVAKCPKGKHATGGGYRVGADDGSMVVTKNGGADGADADLVPDDGWEAIAHNTGASDASLVVSVVCRP